MSPAAYDRIVSACCHLLRAIGVKDVVVVADEALEFMAQEIEAMSPNEPVLGRLYCAAMKASDAAEDSQ